MLISIPETTQCCFYFPLKTETKIFGFMSVLGCLCLAFISLTEIVWEKRGKHEGHTEDLTNVLVLDIIFQLVHVTTSVLLILAAYQEKPDLIAPWLISSPLIALLELFFLPAFFFRFFGYGIHNYGNESLFLKLLMLVDDVYGWFVVFSYYRSLAPQRM